MNDKKNDIDRNLEIYHVIEQYEDYEFTNSIAFQMIMRNDEINKLLIEYFMLEPHNEFNTVRNTKKLEELNVKLLNDYFIDHNILLQLTLEKNKIDGVLYGRIAKSEYPRTRYDLSTYSENIKLVHECGKPRLTEIGKGFFPIFHEPKITVPKNLDKSIDIKINFALPKKEIIAYIAKLKDNYDSNSLCISTPQDRDTTPKIAVKKHANLNFTKSEASYKYADAFYIYDYMKSNIDSEYSNDNLYGDIELNLTLYHFGNSKKTYMGKTQIRKYHIYMTDMIDDCKYKTLFTGNT